MKAKTIKSKPRRTQLTDASEIAALTSAGRWKEGMPLTWREGDTVYAEADVLKEWRDARDKEGKRL